VSYENLFAAHVLPIAKFRRTGPGQYEPIRAAGTGFTFGEGTFVTCWHCVSDPLGEDEVYCAAMRSEGTDSHKYDEAFELADIEQVRPQLDLAIARVNYSIDPVITLAQEPAAWGENVVACGYPLPTDGSSPDTGEAKIDMNAMLLRGYVTRLKVDDRPGWRPVRAYELDMPAPNGISGAPIFREQPLEIVGVVYREHEYEVHDRGARLIFSFALHLSILRDAIGTATDGRPLHQHVVRDLDGGQVVDSSRGKLKTC
jgi:hypothetical protein